MFSKFILLVLSLSFALGAQAAPAAASKCPVCSNNCWTRSPSILLIIVLDQAPSVKTVTVTATAAAQTPSTNTNSTKKKVSDTGAGNGEAVGSLRIRFLCSDIFFQAEIARREPAVLKPPLLRPPR
jgi:hypothetical protein